jgi:hypothetical protein
MFPYAPGFSPYRKEADRADRSLGPVALSPYVDADARPRDPSKHLVSLSLETRTERLVSSGSETEVAVASQRR